MSGLIKITKYQGKAGGFAIEESTLYRVDVRGMDNSVRYGNAYKAEEYTNKEANDWQLFTGWPIQRVEVKKVYKETETEVKSFRG